MISKSFFINPLFNERYVVPAVALSLFIFAYSVIFGQISILCFYLFWMTLLVMRPQFLLNDFTELLPLFGIAIIVLFSTFTSDYPFITLRIGVQYTIFLVCSIVAARACSIRSMSNGVVIGVFIVLIFSFAVGRYNTDVLDGSYSFVGAFRSKNQLGLYSSLGIVFSIFSLFFIRNSVAMKSINVITIFIAFIALYLCSSATSTVVTLLGLIVLFSAKSVMRMSPVYRVVGIVCVVPLLLLVIALAFTGGLGDIGLQLLGKDSTLTGRTYLWSIGIEEFQQRPFLGFGYGAYWIPGRAIAEQIWSEFYIVGKTGFHFHNTYIESLVELGVIGFAFYVILLVLIITRIARRIISYSDTLPAFLLTLFVMIFIRSFVEVEIFFPYGVVMFILIYVMIASKKESLS